MALDEKLNFFMCPAVQERYSSYTYPKKDRAKFPTTVGNVVLSSAR